MVLALLVAVAGCGGDKSASPPAGCTAVTGPAYTLVARNISWNTDCLKVKAGTTVRFTVKLEDEGVKHDLQIFGQGQKEETALQSGPVTQTLSFPFTKGFYQYVCTIHANMEGTIYAQ